ncbi:MAG: diguanylate cyclase [Clostridiales bacterium]|jgi:diguanylate cyclase (GGDEF)-like protein|nr:diguanylate cyclase [Clostridiales bacterium]
MKKTIRKYGLFECIYVMVLIIGAVVLICCQSMTDSYSAFRNYSCTDFSEGWVTSAGEQSSLVDYARTDDGGPVMLSNTLPDAISDDDTLNFRSKNIEFAVLIDGEKRYVFTPDVGYIASKSYGTCFHCVELSSEDAGKTITFAMYPIYDDNSCFINMIAIGNPGAYLQDFLHSHLPPFLICLAIVFIGITVSIAAFVVWRSHVPSINLTSMGMLAILLGTWSCMETLVPQMLSGYTVLYHGLNYLILMSLPYPAVRFADSIMLNPRRIYTKITAFASSVVFVLCCTLNFLQIRDFHQTLIFVHILLIFTSIQILYMFCRDYRYRKQNKLRSNRVPQFAAFVFCIFMSISDLLRYIVSGKGTSDTGYYMRIGLLVFFVTLSFDIVKKLMDRVKKAGQAELMQHLAHTDSLTGIYNRMAFNEREHELQEALDNGTLNSVMVCQMDINELKRVNDTHGHMRGDGFIMAAADAIVRAFDGVGVCYRIGGDEFSVFITADRAEEEYSRCHGKLMKLEEEYNNNSDDEIRLCIACGHAVASGQNKLTLRQAENVADAEMYKNKRKIKVKL